MMCVRSRIDRDCESYTAHVRDWSGTDHKVVVSDRTQGDSDKWPMNRAVCQWTISNVQSHGQCPNSRRPVHAFLKHCFYPIKIVVKIATAFTFGQFIRRIIYSKWLLLENGIDYSSVKWLLLLFYQIILLIVNFKRRDAILTNKRTCIFF